MSVQEWLPFLTKIDPLLAQAASNDVHILVTVPGQQPLVDIDSKKQHEPASLTKLMTAYTILRMEEEGWKAPATLTISKHAWEAASVKKHNPRYGATKIGMNLQQDVALGGMIVGSDNVIANQKAIDYGGTIPARDNDNQRQIRYRAFVDRMNMYAQEIGMKDSYFANPSGLPRHPLLDGDRDATTTAADIATLITRFYKDYPDQAKLYLEEMERTGVTYGFVKAKMPSHRLTRPGSVFSVGDAMHLGCKTGYTDAAHSNIGCMARDNDNNQLVVVILGSDDLPAKQALLTALEGVTFPKAAYNPNKPGQIKGGYARDARANSILQEWKKMVGNLQTQFCTAKETMSDELLAMRREMAVLKQEVIALRQPFGFPVSVDLTGETLVPAPTPLPIPVRCPKR